MNKERVAAGRPLVVATEVVVEAGLPPSMAADELVPLVAFVLGAEGADGPWEVTILLCDDDRLRWLHRDFLGLDSPTDVMTFPAGDEGHGGGDIVVSVERATAQAGEFGHSAAEEIRFLIVHGVLHLCGWDDGSAEDRARMLGRQMVLLDAFGAETGAT